MSLGQLFSRCVISYLARDVVTQHADQQACLDARICGKPPNSKGSVTLDFCAAESSRSILQLERILCGVNESRAVSIKGMEIATVTLGPLQASDGAEEKYQLFSPPGHEGLGHRSSKATLLPTVDHSMCKKGIPC